MEAPKCPALPRGNPILSLKLNCFFTDTSEEYAPSCTGFMHFHNAVKEMRPNLVQFPIRAHVSTSSATRWFLDELKGKNYEALQATGRYKVCRVYQAIQFKVVMEAANPRLHTRQQKHENKLPLYSGFLQLVRKFLLNYYR